MKRIENLYEFLRSQGQLNFKGPKKKKRRKLQTEQPADHERKVPGTLWAGSWKPYLITERKAWIEERP